MGLSAGFQIEREAPIPLSFVRESLAKSLSLMRDQERKDGTEKGTVVRVSSTDRIEVRTAMAAKQIKTQNLAKPWIETPKSTAMQSSARAFITLLLGSRHSECHDSHLRQLISICLWKYSEASGKWNTRYCSEGAFLNPTLKLNHEHVYERARLVGDLLADPNSVHEVLKRCVGCIVLEEEHRLLTRISRENPALEGWARYEAAGIKVIDRLSLTPR